MIESHASHTYQALETTLLSFQKPRNSSGSGLEWVASIVLLKKSLLDLGITTSLQANLSEGSRKKDDIQNWTWGA
jgi:hypothetical protein